MCLLLCQFIFIHPPIIVDLPTTWIISFMSIVPVSYRCLFLSKIKKLTLSKPEPVQTEKMVSKAFRYAQVLPFLFPV